MKHEDYIKIIMENINTHNLIVDFGKHKGERWTKVPVSYLQWLCNEVGGEKANIAKSELNRRGTTIRTELELSGHAIDRASQITNEWKSEGIWSWLTKISNEAWNSKISEEYAEEYLVLFKGYRFCFVNRENYPTLKTIMKD